MGLVLGQVHAGRHGASSIHSGFAPFVVFLFIFQVLFGVYTRLPLSKGTIPYLRIRAVVTKIHGVIGKIIPIAGWIQMVLGEMALLEICKPDDFLNVRYS